eukprot:TRINITY_DN2647_c0_g1_i1.p1 TRINITY_DN2647_c0_g1~~TRINITY_DN2647_c0_g1_i1.p1  ORF type:complete len:795 (+),score=324.71 TRINITY_DN2647_c0_g1_i1:190-2574(+)
MGDVLLTWSKSRTKGYSNVQIVNLSDNWEDGLAFCAIIHSYHPESINYNSLKPATRETNRSLALSVAEGLGAIEPDQSTKERFERGNLDKGTILSVLGSFYHSFEQQSQGNALNEAKESQQAKERLEKAQRELLNLKDKLNASRKGMEEKEQKKAHLESQVEKLKIMLSSEERHGQDMQREQQAKILRLQQKIEETSGTEKMRLIQELKQEQGKRLTLQSQQTQLENEVRELKDQLKQEEKTTKRLEEETRRKEEEKRNLAELHKLKMRELKKKLADSIQEQSIWERKINEEIVETARLDTLNQGVKANISETKDRIEETLTDKEQIAQIKKRLQQKLKEAEENLDLEKRETKDVQHDNRKLKSKYRHEQVVVEDTTSDIRTLEAKQRDLEAENALKSDDIQQTAAAARNFQVGNQSLQLERKNLESDIQDENESQERRLAELDQKLVSKIGDLEKAHARDLTKIAKNKSDAAQEAENASDQYAAKLKQSEKLANNHRKLERLNAQTERLVDQSSKDREEMESRKRNLERKLAKAAEYLSDERTKVKSAKDKSKKAERESSKSKSEAQEEKRRRENAENYKDKLAEENRDAKMTLTEAQLEQNLQFERSKNLSSEISEADAELEAGLASRDDQLEKISKNRNSQLGQVRRKGEKELREIDSRKSEAHRNLSQLSEEHENSEETLQRLQAEQSGLEDSTREISEKIERERITRNQLNSSKAHLESEILKATSFLEGDSKEAQRQEKLRKKADRASRRMKTTLETSKSENSQLHDVTAALQQEFDQLSFLLEVIST